jgi:hypothetical protein
MRDFFRDVDIEPQETGVVFKALTLRATQLFTALYGVVDYVVTDSDIERNLARRLRDEGFTIYRPATEGTTSR